MEGHKPVSILLVEDDEVDQQAVKRAFNQLKLANPLVVAKDGIEALDVLRSKEGHSIERPYLILLDLNMPRMNGLEFLKEIRNDKKLKDIVAFVLTTSKDEKDIVAAYDLNIAGYIVKSDVSNGFVKALDMLEHYWRIVELPKEYRVQ